MQNESAKSSRWTLNVSALCIVAALLVSTSAGYAEEVLSRKIHHPEVLALAVSGGEVVTIGSDYRVCTLDGRSLDVLSESRLPSRWGNAISVRPSHSECAIACSDGSIQAYQPSSPKLVTKVRSHSDWALCVIFQNSDVILSGGRDQKVIFSKWDSGERLFDLEAEFWVECVAVSSDAQYVAAGCWGGTVSLWSLADRKLIKTIQVVERGYAVLALAFSRDGKSLYISSQREEVMRRTIPGLQEDLRFRGHSDSVSAIHLMDSVLLTASNDGTVRSWEVESGKLLWSVSPGIGVLNCMAVGPDGKHCYVGSRRGMVARTILPTARQD